MGKSTINHLFLLMGKFTINGHGFMAANIQESSGKWPYTALSFFGKVGDGAISWIYHVSYVSFFRK